MVQQFRDGDGEDLSHRRNAPARQRVRGRAEPVMMGARNPGWSDAPMTVFVDVLGSN